MLTKLTVRNFKKFEEIVIELGEAVVLIGPNNSGKTSALQALSLWELGLRKWNEKKGGKEATAKRPGVVINRRDLFAVAVLDSNHLWKDLHVRDVTRVGGAAKSTRNIRIEIIVEGVSKGKSWSCGLEFDFANRETFHCRPLRVADEKDPQRMPVPAEADEVRVAFLPPMSGLVDREFMKLPGELGFLIGQGRTAEVLRNLCWQAFQAKQWAGLTEKMKRFFGIQLQIPDYIPERSEIQVQYKDPSGVMLDISSSGRGVQQTLLLLAYLAMNPGSVLLLDEPDAHLEILRQRQIYRVLTETAREQGSQIVAASHSEVVLNEAAGRDIVVAFVGKPHRIDNRGSQVLKSLKDIGFEEYYQAEHRGWVLYLEGSTDLFILQSLARKLGHPAVEALDAPFVHYIENQPNRAVSHFSGLQEAKLDLRGLVLCDRLEREFPPAPDTLTMRMWKRREIENYVCSFASLLAYARRSAERRSLGPLFAEDLVRTDEQIMRECVQLLVPPVAIDDAHDRWWINTKASTDFLDRLFELYYERLALPNLMRKTNYHILAEYVERDEIDEEVPSVLDEVFRVSQG